MNTQSLQTFMETISGWVWGPYMLVLIVGTGIFLHITLVLLANPHVASGL